MTYFRLGDFSVEADCLSEGGKRGNSMPTKTGYDDDEMKWREFCEELYELRVLALAIAGALETGADEVDLPNPPDVMVTRFGNTATVLRTTADLLDQSGSVISGPIDHQ